MKTGTMVIVAGTLLLAGGTAAWVLGSDRAEVSDLEEPSASPREGKRGGVDAPLFGDSEAKSIRRGKRALEARVSRLEQEVKALRRELQLRRVVGGASGGDGDADPGDPDFSQAVRDIVQEDRTERIEQESDMRRVRWDERSSEALERLAETISLSEKQRETIASAWSSEADQLLPIITAARSGDKDWREARDELIKVREGTDANVEAVLDKEQYEAYLEARPRGPGGRGGGRGQGRN